MKFGLNPKYAHWAFIGLTGWLLALVLYLLFGEPGRFVVIGALLSALFLLALLYDLQAQTQANVQAGEEAANNFRQELTHARTVQDSRTGDLSLLGRYGNLLLGCTDLAEALQISEQMLSLLLPDHAGTIYPLIDGEGLAEATHLWGIHVGGTNRQAGSDDCWSMHRKRTHMSHSDTPGSLCAHIELPTSNDSLTAACIPLIAQGESLGWLYLSAPGNRAFPKLQVAVAAADQLSLALANLKLRQSLRDLSVRDPLTGLFNRRYLSESLGREMARCKRRNTSVAVMAFDLDHFKRFNDTYGHPAGDAVLVAFARLLQSHSRHEDVACRQGGEEFVLILPEMAIDTATRRAEELMAELARIDVLHEGQMLPKLTTSIGLAIFPDHGQNPEEMLGQADLALYEAKSRGRNCVSVVGAR